MQGRLSLGLQTRVASCVSAALTAMSARAGSMSEMTELWTWDWPDIYSIRRRMSCHARVLVKIFKIGESHGSDNERRVRGAFQQDCDTIPILFTLPKDHKDKEENGDPKTRQVCGAKRSVIEGEETDESISLKRCSTTQRLLQRRLQLSQE